MKEYILKNTITLQIDILANFGNSGYQKVSKDFNLYNIPKELYDLWYNSINFSFLNLIDIHRIKYFSNKELLEYYTQLVSLNTKLEVIFNNIEKQRLNIISEDINNKKITLLKKLIKLLYGG